MFRVLAPLFASVLALFGASAAQATIDVSAVTGILSGDVTTAVTAVGGAVLAVLAIVMAFKFIRRAM